VPPAGSEKNWISWPTSPEVPGTLKIPNGPVVGSAYTVRANGVLVEHAAVLSQTVKVTENAPVLPGVQGSVLVNGEDERDDVVALPHPRPEGAVHTPELNGRFEVVAVAVNVTDWPRSTDGESNPPRSQGELPAQLTTRAGPTAVVSLLAAGAALCTGPFSARLKTAGAIATDSTMTNPTTTTVASSHSVGRFGEIVGDRVRVRAGL
jgi:hypothetical protein